jgi:hypothetical protein
MNPLVQKITHQSEVILVLAKVARIILFVLLGLSILLLISTWAPGDQPILKIGGIQVYATIPLKSLLGSGIAGQVKSLTDFRIDLSAQVAAFVLAQVMLRMVIKLFTRIRESKSPFTEDVVKIIKVLAILLGLVVGVDNSILGVVIAFVIYTFALIFQYGTELQNQSDETL